MKKYLTIPNMLSLFIAFVFVQSFFYKLTGAPETIYIFTQVGTWMKDGLGLSEVGQGFIKYGRFVTAGFEAVSVIFLFSKIRVLGALLALCTMSGAIFFHLFTPLGIKMPEYNKVGTVIGDDGGLLFILACTCWLFAVVIITLEFKKIKDK